MTTTANTQGSLLFQSIEEKVSFRSQYGNWIDGKDCPPLGGEYFDNVSPVTGEVYCRVARSRAEDVDLAVDAAWRAFPAWGSMAAAERARILERIADRIEENLETLATVETWDNGKPIRETMAADVPLAADHFRYFAAAARTQEGGISQIDASTVAYHFHEPLGVVGQIIPWNFPLLMAAWKLPPALAAGNCVVLKAAEQTPISIMVLMELIADLLPPGVLNVVQGYGEEAGAPLAAHKGIRKIAFTGSTEVGRLIARSAADNIIPVTLELGGKSPNIFFADILEEDDSLAEKALEGFAMFAFNQGEVCTCPSRAIIEESVYERFMEGAMKKVAAIKQGNPFEADTALGAQVSQEQLDRIVGYVSTGKEEGAELVSGGERARPGGELNDGFYVQPTIFKGDNKMRIFQEEVFGPFVSVTTFKTPQQALAIANDTPYGLGAGVWSRDNNRNFSIAKGLQAGRVWSNCYHLYPSHAAFGGYKESGVGRECHKSALQAYQQTKNVLASYSDQPLGFY